MHLNVILLYFTLKMPNHLKFACEIAEKKLIYRHILRSPAMCVCKMHWQEPGRLLKLITVLKVTKKYMIGQLKVKLRSPSLPFRWVVALLNSLVSSENSVRCISFFQISNLNILFSKQVFRYHRFQKWFWFYLIAVKIFV